MLENDPWKAITNWAQRIVVENDVAGVGYEYGHSRSTGIVHDLVTRNIVPELEGRGSSEVTLGCDHDTLFIYIELLTRQILEYARGPGSMIADPIYIVPNMAPTAEIAAACRE